MVSRSVIAVVAVVVIIVAVGAYYMSAGPSAGPTTAPTKPTTPTQVLDGKKLYTDNCAACHGEKGVGKTAKALTASNADRTMIEKGNVDKGMPAFGNSLTPDQITTIIDYLKS